MKGIINVIPVEFVPTSLLIVEYNILPILIKKETYLGPIPERYTTYDQEKWLIGHRIWGLNRYRQIIEELKKRRIDPGGVSADYLEKWIKVNASDREKRDYIPTEEECRSNILKLDKLLTVEATSGIYDKRGKCLQCGRKYEKRAAVQKFCCEDCKKKYYRKGKK